MYLYNTGGEFFIRRRRRVRFRSHMGFKFFSEFPGAEILEILSTYNVVNVYFQLLKEP